MGSSKYENNPEQLNIDYQDRINFFEMLKVEWSKMNLEPKELYETLVSLNYFTSVRGRYKEAGYKFRFTHGGLTDVALLFCSDLKEKS
jgi:hypothetical protein